MADDAQRSADNARIVKVLIRHRFIEVPGTAEPLGFCAGPYCAGGVTTPERHAEHVADALVTRPVSSTTEETP